MDICEGTAVPSNWAVFAKGAGLGCEARHTHGRHTGRCSGFQVLGWPLTAARAVPQRTGSRSAAADTRARPRLAQTPMPVSGR